MLVLIRSGWYNARMFRFFSSKRINSFFQVMGRLDFLSVAAALILVNWFTLAPDFLPQQDAKLKVELFYFFYNTVLQKGTWPLWMPLHTFGLPSGIWQWVGLTPVHYLAIAVGKVFGTTDVLGLFKVCQILSELFFACGLYVLGRSLWAGRYVSWLVCMGCGLFHWCFIDPFQRFSVFYLLPWILWLLVSFFRTGQAWRLWAVPVGVILWMMGNVLYYFFVYVWLLVIFTATLWFLRRRSFRPNFNNRSAWRMMALMLIVIAVLGFQFHDFLSQNVTLLRSGGSGKNPISDFMTYGPVYQGGWEKFIHYFVLGDDKEIYLPSAQCFP